MSVFDQYPVLDGFAFNSLLKCDLSFLPLAIEEYDALRRSGCYRTKQWPVPKDSSAITIPAFDSYETQLYVKPGSAIWGYTLVGNFGSDEGQLSVLVTDACDDTALFSEHTTRQFAEQNTAGFSAPQQAMARLLIVPPPGLLNVVIASTFATEQIAQIVFWGGEPV
jgi:hypothetical protein